MRDSFRDKSSGVCLFLLFFTQITGFGSGCRMVAVPKGPWHARERVIHTEYLAGEEVSGKTLVITPEWRGFFGKNERDDSGSSIFRDAGLLNLTAEVRRSCKRRKREKYEIHESREFTVHGCRGAAGLLCAILPATIITSVAGIPLIAYGSKRLRDVGGHDSNAVGMIAAGSLLAGAGLAGVVCCPISKFMDRRCKRMSRKVRRSGPRTRIVSESQEDCGTDVLANADVFVECGTGKAQRMKLETDQGGLLVLDLLHFMARNTLETPPGTLVFSKGGEQGRKEAVESLQEETGDTVHGRAGDSVRVEPFVMELPDFVVKRLVRSVRRETLTLQQAKETEFLRPVAGGVRYRILRIECSDELLVTVTAFHPERGRVWIKATRGLDGQTGLAEQGSQAKELNAKTGLEEKVVSVEQSTSVSFKCTPETRVRIFLLADPGGEDVAGFMWQAR